MRSAAETVAARGADIIDLNMGCPVPKVCKTGAGAALIKDPDTAVAVARAAREGSGLPVTVKLRSGARTGEVDGFHLAQPARRRGRRRAIAFHPRSAQVHHKGTPDYELAARLVEELPVPVILSGGLHDREATERAYEQTGAAAVMLARGSLGNPWLFAELLGERDGAAVARGDRRRAALGHATARSSTSARSAPAATCASSTPGTSSAWAPRRLMHERFQRAATLGRGARALVAALEPRSRRPPERPGQPP